MANNFDSNTTEQVARVFLEKFEDQRVLSKNVDTQLFDGKFTPQYGDTISVKRPTDFVTIRTPDGDLTGNNPSPITAGKASATVQDYFTVYVDYLEADEAIKMDQLDQLLEPKATRIKNDFELDFARFMARNTALLAGEVGVPITKWDHIAEQGAVMESHGIPMDGNWCSVVNSFTQRKLASDQRSLGAGGTAGGMIKTAHDRATITDNFAGMRVMTGQSLANFRTSAEADRVGTLAANPVVTYLAAKDTMTQQLAVTGLGPNLEVKAGEVLQISGRYRLNLATREIILDENGAPLLWTATVTQDAVLDGAGAGTLIATGPAIFGVAEEAAYNTIDSAPVAGDVVTLLGAPDTILQPGMFWHKQAFTVASVPIKKLHATDTVGTTEDGLQFRVTMASDFIKNQQMMRIDFRPAYGVMNPFFAGQGYGRA